ALYVAVIFSRPSDPPALHSFPTRRSSDLTVPGAANGGFRQGAYVCWRPDRGVGNAAGRAPPRGNRRSSRQRNSRRNTSYGAPRRSEEHTSELQSPYDLVCRLLHEKKITHI